MKNTFSYLINNKMYQINVTYRRMKSIRYRFKDDVFYVTCPFFTSRYVIEQGLNKFGLKLINKTKKSSPLGDDYAYIYGNKIPLSFPSGEIVFTNGEILKYDSKEEFEKKMSQMFLKFISTRVRYYEKIMNIKEPYKIKTRKMSSRYGSNSRRTHTLNFSSVLFHYSPSIIDAVVVHELCHHFAFDHSTKFYTYVYKYYPNYKVEHFKLKKGIYR